MAKDTKKADKKSIVMPKTSTPPIEKLPEPLHIAGKTPNNPAPHPIDRPHMTKLIFSFQANFLKRATEYPTAL